MTVVHTRVHVYVEFANPYLKCGCGAWVTAWHDPERCGCDSPAWNMPCEHEALAVSACDSWGPVDGCTCRQTFGTVEHAEPTLTPTPPAPAPPASSP